jgi:DNA polymerase-3 subunit alpha (Gram-positive type)
MFNLYDGTSTITCKSFVEADKSKEILERISKAKRLKIAGNLQYDNFSKDLTIIANTIIEMPNKEINKRKDRAETKRVELHMHTQMSQMDGVSSVKSLVKQAADFGMKAIAITDHGNVQAFPEAKYAAKETGIKVIYGVEAYLVADQCEIGSSSGSNTNTNELSEYCIIDIETTGLQFRTDKITEIGVVKVRDGEIIDTFETLINPLVPIPFHITKITNITDDMVKGKETIKEVIPKLLEFIGDAILVAHNATFDMGFIRYNVESLGYEFKNGHIDTLALSRKLFPEFKKHKLEIIANNLGIKVDVAHRALDDVKTLHKIYNEMRKKMLGTQDVPVREDTRPVPTKYI